MAILLIHFNGKSQKDNCLTEELTVVNEIESNLQNAFNSNVSMFRNRWFNASNLVVPLMKIISSPSYARRYTSTSYILYIYTIYSNNIIHTVNTNLNFYRPNRFTQSIL